MDPDVKKLLEEILKVSKANNSILKSIRREQRWARFFKLIRWIAIIVILLGGYLYLIQPLLDRLTEAYNGFTETVGKVQNAGQSVVEVRSDATSFFDDLFTKKKDSEETTE